MFSKHISGHPISGCVYLNCTYKYLIRERNSLFDHKLPLLYAQAHGTDTATRRAQARLWAQLLDWQQTRPLRCQIKSRNADGKGAFSPSGQTATWHRRGQTDTIMWMQETHLKLNPALPRRHPTQVWLCTDTCTHRFLLFLFSAPNLVRNWENYLKNISLPFLTLRLERTNKKTQVWKETAASTWAQCRDWDFPSVSARSSLSSLDYVCTRQDLI